MFDLVGSCVFSCLVPCGFDLIVWVCLLDASLMCGLVRLYVLAV